MPIYTDNSLSIGRTPLVRLNRITQGAKATVLERRNLSARDAVHIAVMERHHVGRILTFDTGFDGVRGIERLTS